MNHVSKKSIKLPTDFTVQVGLLRAADHASQRPRASRHFVTLNQVAHGGRLLLQVLTTGFWPSYQLLDVALPQEMAGCTDIFSKYYLDRTSHRTLKFVHSLGNATVLTTTVLSVNTPSLDPDY